MSSVFETAVDLFNQGDSLSKLGEALNTNSSDTSKALGAAGPAIIGGLANKANASGGADQVGNLLDHNNGSVLGNLGGSFTGDSGSSLVSAIFGNGLDGVVAKIAGSSGLSSSVIAKTLPAIAPIITGIVSKKRADGALSNTQVASLLATEKADLIGGGHLGGAAASSSGVMGATKSVGSTAAGPSKSAASWLWPAIAVVAALIFLAWLLSQCNDDSGVSTDSTVTAPSEADDGADTNSDIQAALDAALADTEGTDGVSASVDADGVVTLTGEVADEATQTKAEEAAAAVEGVTSVDNQTTVAADPSDATDSELQAFVDSALAGFDGVAGTVNTDGVVTLTGEVADEATQTKAEEAAAAVEGVTSVDNRLTIGDASETETVNEQLDLDPITFEVNQAVITAEGQGVLDEAAAYFESNADVTFEIGGHTDSDGDDASNLTLSQSRADSVKVYLEGKGIDASRMATKGYGEANPKVENDTSADKATNRRIEFTVD